MRRSSPEMAEIRAFRDLARLMLKLSGTGVILVQGVKIMASKFETFAFAFGFIATGFLTFVALPLA